MRSGWSVWPLSSNSTLSKRILRYRSENENRKLTAYTHGVAGSLIAIAKEWVRVPNDSLAALKATRHKLGALPIGLTDKNKNMLRQFNDKRLLQTFVRLPDKLWHHVTRELKTSRRGFIDLQNSLAIDILLVAPLRMENLTALKVRRAHPLAARARKTGGYLVQVRGNQK